MSRYDQSPHSLLLVRPASFGFNIETVATNAFQQISDRSPADIQKDALAEFDRLVLKLESNDIDAMVLNDDALTLKPDAIFPNNWISFHHDGTVIVYPMLAVNRRSERRKDILDVLKPEFIVKNVWDISSFEAENKFLEGTGSLVFDHLQRIVYCAVSPRSSPELVTIISQKLGYKPVVFHAIDENQKPIYHTNVVMSIGNKFAIVCLDAIRDEDEQEILLQNFANSDRKVIAISYAQMKAFAGNVLEVSNRHGEAVVLISETAIQSLLPGQLNAISQFAEILPLKIDTIEKYGGGSVRCMVAGIHLPKQPKMA